MAQKHGTTICEPSFKAWCGWGQSLHQGQIAIIQDNTWDPKNRLNYVVYSDTVAAVQLLSYVQLFETPETEACQAPLSFTISWSLFKLMSIKSVMLSNHLIFCCSLLLLPSIFPSIKVFFNESALCIRRPKYWSFNFSVNPANEYSGLTYFRIDWFDLLAVQGTLKPQMPSMCY